MEPAEDEKQIVLLRIERLSLHLRPPCNNSHHLWIGACGSEEKLEVKIEKLALFMRGKYRDVQEEFAYFNSRPELRTPVEISKDEHRELCRKQILGMVREAGIRPFRYVIEDPAKYFAIVEAAGSMICQLGIKLRARFSRLDLKID